MERHNKKLLLAVGLGLALLVLTVLSFFIKAVDGILANIFITLYNAIGIKSSIGCIKLK